jgi:uncharacterized membrane protein YphA (DoxX/SURF4 family)
LENVLATDAPQLAFDLRAVLAVVFLLAGLLKIGRGVSSEGLTLLEAIGLPATLLIRVAVAILPATEMGLGIWLLTGSHAVEALVIVLILIFVFSLIIAIAIKSNYGGSCSCFGQAGGRVGFATLSLDLSLLVVATAALGAELRVPGASLSLRDAGLGNLLTVVGMSGCLFAVKAMIHEIEMVLAALADK